jgi:hypothetical protein
MLIHFLSSARTVTPAFEFLLCTGIPIIARSHIQIRALSVGNISGSGDSWVPANLRGPEVKCESTFGCPKSDILPIPI